MRLLTTLLLVAAVLASAGCLNPFKPATPERPTQGAAVLENFDEPESVLVTITRAVSAKTSGASAYQESLAESFTAEHDPAVVGRYTIVPDVWDLTYERGFLFPSLSGLRSKAYGMAFWRNNDLFPDDVTALAQGHVLYRRFYAIYTLDEATAANDTICIGYADLSIDRPTAGTRWSLTKWTDHVIPALTATPANTNLQSMGARRLASLTSTP